MPIRSVVEGAMLACLTAVLGLIGIYILPLALITNLIWTIPIVVAIVRHNWRTGLMSLLVAGIIIGMFTGPLQALIMMLQFGGLAIVLGLAFKNKWSLSLGMLWGTGTATISLVILIWGSMLLTGFSPVQLDADFRRAMEEAFQFYQQQGILARYEEQGITQEQFRGQVENMYNTLKLIVPSIIVLTGMMSAAVNLLISRSVLRRIGVAVTEWTPFREWRLPWHFVWGFILGLALYQLGDYLAHEELLKAGLNILFIYYPILLVLGSSVVAYFWSRYPVHPMVKAILIFFGILYFHVVQVILVGLGLFDLVANFRHKIKEKTEG